MQPKGLTAHTFASRRGGRDVTGCVLRPVVPHNRKCVEDPMLLVHGTA